MAESFEFPFTQPIVVSYRDIDALGHVNNAVYLSYIEDVRIRYILKLLNDERITALPLIVAESTIRYLRPVFYNDSLIAGIRIASIGNKSFLMEFGLYRPKDTTLVADGKTVMVYYDYQRQTTIPVPQSFRSAVEREQGSLPPAMVS